MKTTLAAMLAATLAASVTPAAACDYYCFNGGVGDDSFPPGQTPLPPSVRMEVVARQGLGLSLAGFYNDPSLALAAQYYAPRRGPAVLRRAY